MMQSWLSRSAVAAAATMVGVTGLVSTALAAISSWGSSTSLAQDNYVNHNVLGNAQVAVSADGSKALAVWVGPNREVIAKSATINGNVETWGSPTTLTSGGRRLAYDGFETDLSIALSDDGATAIVAWTESDTSYGNWQISSASASISGTTATWSSATSVSGAQVNDPVKVDYPQIKISADGTKATAVWLRRGTYTSWSLESASAVISSGAATWGSVSVIDGPYYSTTPYPYTDPSLGLSDDGTKATVVWAHGDNSTHATVKSASATIAGSPANTAAWSSPQALTASSKKVEGVTVAVSSTGLAAVAVWRLDPGPGTYVPQSAAATIIGNAATWGIVTALDDGTQDAWNTQIALSSDGTKATVVWVGRTNANDRVKSVSGTVSSTTLAWGLVSLISDAGTSSLYYPAVHLSADGTVAFADWLGDFSCTRVWATVSGSSASWGTPSSVTNDAGSSAGVERAALSQDGSRATMLCQQTVNANSNATLYSQSYAPENDGGGGGDTLPPDGGGDTLPPDGGGDTLPPGGGDDTLHPSGGGNTLPSTGVNDSTPILFALPLIVGGVSLLAVRRRTSSARS